MRDRQVFIRKKLWFVLGTAALSATLLAGAASTRQAPAPSAADAKPADPYAGLSYRFIGPPGNRVSAVVGVPGDPNIYYAGAASGGVWKSTDGGIHWKPVFDEQTAQSVGSIAIAPISTILLASLADY